MRGVFEFTGFTGLALALHMVALQGLPQGSQSAGSGGDALVTVVAVSSDLSQMVAAWDRPPLVETPMIAALPQMTAPDSSVGPRHDRALDLVDQPASPMALAIPSQEAPLSPQLAQTAPQPVQPPAQTRPPERPSPPVTAVKPASDPQPKPRAASTAAGQGAAAAQGVEGKAQTASLSQAVRHSLLAEWGASIRNRIDRAKPRGTGRGTVTLVLQVGRDGGLRSVGIAQSSGQAGLDQQAVQTVRAAGRLPTAPAGLTEDSYTFRLPLRFN